MSGSFIWLIVYVSIHVAVFIRALSVEGKEPVSRAAWILILVFLPGIGIVAYLLFGEPWVARRSRRKAGTVAAELASKTCVAATPALDAVPDRFRSAFRTCERLAGCPVAGHNSAILAADSNAAIESMVGVTEVGS